MRKLLDTLAAWREFDVLVVGDFMLDQLVYGNADRLSPDAPVPVLHWQRQEDRPGGASNVCLDLAAMRARVRTFGVIGADANGRRLRELFTAAGVYSEGLVEDSARPTTVKQSLIGMAQHRHPQRMFRLDYESREPISTAVEERLLSAFEASLTALGGKCFVCIEDYGKGVCTARVCQGVIAMARRAGAEVLVDPAAIADYSKYKGATVITPNRAEAALAAGMKVAPDATPLEHADLARRLVESIELDAVVVTLDRHGALLLERGGEPVEAPTVARQVYDVSGAGDMVLAALAGARAHGLGWVDAVKLANVAAGLEVAVFGVVPIPIEQIHREVLTRERTGHGGHEKTRTLEELLVEVAALRREGQRVVFANGCFDVLHSGHLSLLRQAAACGDFLVVAINSDDSVRKLKGPERPVYNERDRAELLGGLGCVGAVVVFADDTPERLINAIRPDVLVKGAEYQGTSIPGAAFVESYGGRVELITMVAGRSTTKTVERLRAR
jgi:D-beta-D-heptose 7-phosphate kinase / D-beta-D-heptose 1-phosphate adenosyltransferase